MAVAAKYTRFLFGDATAAFDFSGDSNSLSMALTVAPLQNTGFQATAETYIAGLTTGMISQAGLFDWGGLSRHCRTGLGRGITGTSGREHSQRKELGEGGPGP